VNTYITRDEIQEVNDIQFEDVPVDEWKKDAKIRIVGMNAKEATAFSKSLVKMDPDGKVTSVKMDGFMEEMIIRTAHTEDMKPMFTKADKEWLGSKSAKVLKRLAETAQRLSGMDNVANDNAAKNSDGISEEDKPSD
jgi:hypothetical protein